MIHTDTASLHRAARVLRESGHLELADQVEAIWNLRVMREVEESLAAAMR